MTESFHIEPLGSGHDRSGFACGVESLDRYLKTQAAQDVRRHVAACYVAIEAGTPGRIAGYYTLAAAGVPLTDLPEPLAKRLPRYPSVPVARLGRLAVDQTFRGRKLGGALLWDAGNRALRSELAAFALVVDAKDEQAAAFYLHFGFTPFAGNPLQLVLPLATFAKT